MSISEAVSRSISEAVSPSANDAASTPGEAEASSSGRRQRRSGSRRCSSLGLVGALGYTQWWIPREEARQMAQVKHQHCLEEVKVYLGKRGYAGRLAQCNKFLNE